MGIEGLLYLTIVVAVRGQVRVDLAVQLPLVSLKLKDETTGRVRYSIYKRVDHPLGQI